MDLLLDYHDLSAFVLVTSWMSIYYRPEYNYTTTDIKIQKENMFKALTG